MQIEVNRDVKAVLEFMKDKVPAERAIGVADALPNMARLLWSNCPQEPCTPMFLSVPKQEGQNQLLPTASE